MELKSFMSRYSMFVVHWGLTASCVCLLAWIAAHPEFVMGAERMAAMPASWAPPPWLVIPSLLGVGLLGFAVFQPVLGLLIFVALGYGFPRQDYFEFYCRWHAQEAVVVLALSASICSWLHARAMGYTNGCSFRELVSQPVNCLMLALLCWILLTAAVAELRNDYQPAFNHHPLEMVGATVMLFLASCHLCSRTNWWWLGVVVGGTLCARVALAPQYVHLNGDLGVLLAIAIPLTLLATLSGSNWIAKLTALSLTTFQLLALYWTENRGGAVALAVASIAVWCALPRKWIVMLVAVPLLAGGFGYFSETDYWGRIQSIWQGGPDRASVDSRLLIYEGGWNMALANPWFGVGLGNFETQVAKYSPAGISDSPHNNLIGMLAETGFIGGTLYLLLFGTSIIKCFAAARRATQFTGRWMWLTLAASLIAYLVSGMFMTRHTLSLAYLLAGATGCGISNLIAKHPKHIRLSEHRDA